MREPLPSSKEKYKVGDRYDANVIGRDVFTDTAVLKIIDNYNAGAPGIVRSSDDGILSTISVMYLQKSRWECNRDLVTYKPLTGY